MVFKGRHGKWSINIWEHIQDHCLSEKCKSECVEVLFHLRRNSYRSENSQQQSWQGCGEPEGLGPRWWQPDEDSSTRVSRDVLEDSKSAPHRDACTHVYCSTITTLRTISLNYYSSND